MIESRVLIVRFSVGIVSAMLLTRWKRFLAPWSSSRNRRAFCSAVAPSSQLRVSNALMAAQAVIMACRLESGMTSVGRVSL